MSNWGTGNGVGRKIEIPMAGWQINRGNINTVSELTALVHIAERITVSLSGSPNITMIKSAIDLIAETIVCMNYSVVADFVRNRARLMLALKLLSEAKHHDAMLCLAIAVDFAEEDDDFKAKVFQLAFGLDVHESHSWTLSIDTFSEKVLINSLVIPSLKDLRADNESVVILKNIELDYLKRHGHSIYPTEALTVLSSGIELEQIYIDSKEVKSSQKLAIAHPLQSVLQSMAFHSPALFSDLAKRSDRSSVVHDLYQLRRFRPVYLVISYLGYPMGGGESFMHQTCRILNELGYRCVWASFSYKGRLYPSTSEARTPYFEEIRIEGGVSNAKIDELIERFRPDVIHSHGATNIAVAEAGARHRVPTLIGFHFWNGLVHLNAATNNRNILNFAEFHKVDPDIFRRQRPYVSTYVASEFMLEVYQKAGGRTQHQVYHPVPDPSHYQIEPGPLGDMVVQVNTSEGKGGGITLECIEALGQEIPFYAVQTEPGSDVLEAKIEAAIRRSPGSVFTRYGPIKTHLRNARMVIVPTLVDETFCRIAFEAAANGIPVLSTDKGFLPTLFGETGVFLSEDPPEWIAKIAELYHDRLALEKIGQSQKRYILERFGNVPTTTIAALIDMTERSPNRNVGILVPWSQQGLGEVARTYAGIFRKLGIKTHILSFQAYAARNKGLAVQDFPDDWTTNAQADSIHYSLNDREHVTLHEIEQFSVINNIGSLIYPEVCYAMNWQKIANFRMTNLEVIAVPMVETARSSEVRFHNSLSGTWFNTRQCEQVLTRAGVENGRYVGHGFGERLSGDFVEAKVSATLLRGRIVFCHIGGHNPLSRKQTGKVIEAFQLAALKRRDIFLRVCIMDGFSEGVSQENHDQIEFNYRTLRHSEIVNVYKDADVSIQVSSHEGLGLGFFESISVATPVISLDLPPHNEVVKAGVSGWLLPVKALKLVDNREALVEGGLFEIEDLARVIENISPDDVASMTMSTAKLHSGGFSEPDLAVRIATVLTAQK